jgi:hypothetical protein
MFYDDSDGGKNYRMHCGVSLGWWHTYKHVALKIWDVFATTIWAPLFHHLYPGVTFFKKMKKLTQVLAIYQACMVAYRDVYEDLREAVRDEHAKYHGTAKLALKEFEFVFDYALPVVRNPMLSFVSKQGWFIFDIKKKHGHRTVVAAKVGSVFFDIKNNRTSFFGNVLRFQDATASAV